MDGGVPRFELAAAIRLHVGHGSDLFVQESTGPKRRLPPRLPDALHTQVDSFLMRRESKRLRKRIPGENMYGSVVEEKNTEI